MDASHPDFLTGDAVGIQKAAKLLHAGQCVAAPTETVYGLAGNAFNEHAVRSIFAIKSRPYIDPLIVHIHAIEQLTELTRLDDEQLSAVKLLAAEFWPGPLTMVLPKTKAVSGLVTANRDSVAIRQPAHPVMRELLRTSGLFLAAPSANPFGYISPTTAQHVRESLGIRCPHILDGGPCENGVESTIIDLRDPRAPVLLRPGPIGLEQLKDVLHLSVKRPAPASDASLAPGMLERHYSPRTKLSLHTAGSLPATHTGEAKLLLQRPPNADSQHTFWLSESGNLNEVAQNLFSLLRALDADEAIQHIHCEMPPAGPGIADAIRDRLNRASKR
ncbi:L-threonylcarbamoyladenylate synthase [Cerasicoccus maritimus]|uniref:L-threonylcarbamoyladenylate synthase n=1 Tax=Cerasicoccus maritimus TaxID=490089 RepID=UPI0028529D35|nr:L-threonylcarbamoyladenylate synthase [Cerasicoccus maritimus]